LEAEAAALSAVLDIEFSSKRIWPCNWSCLI
jgi:hypothetical protein